MQAFSLFSVLFLALIVYHKMAFNAVISRLSAIYNHREQTLIMITLCACEKTDELKGTWVLDGAYNLGTGEVISMEQLRTTDANTDILMTFDGLGDYQLEYTDANGKKLELKDTYEIPENEYELKLGADSSAIPITIMYYSDVSTFEDKHDSFLLISFEERNDVADGKEMFYQLRKRK